MSAAALKERGNEHVRLGQHAEALLAYNEALALPSLAALTRAQLYSNRALCESKLGRREEAARSAEAGLAALGDTETAALEGASGEALALKGKLLTRALAARSPSHPLFLEHQGAAARMHARGAHVGAPPLDAESSARALAAVAPLPTRLALWHSMTSALDPGTAARPPPRKARAWASDPSSGQLYAFGGVEVEGRLPGRAEGGNGVYALDATAERPSWRCLHPGGEGAELPAPRSSALLALHGCALWLWGGDCARVQLPMAAKAEATGGEDPGAFVTRTRADAVDHAMWRFDLRERTWQRVEQADRPRGRAKRGGGAARGASAPRARFGSGAAVRGEGAEAEWCVFGGNFVAGAGAHDHARSLWAWRFASRAWALLSDGRATGGRAGAAPAARSSPLVFAAGGALFVYGGCDDVSNTSLGDLWAHGCADDPPAAAAAGAQWRALPCLGDHPRCLQEAACAHVRRADGSSVVAVFGGYFSVGETARQAEMVQRAQRTGEAVLQLHYSPAFLNAGRSAAELASLMPRWELERRTAGHNNPYQPWLYVFEPGRLLWMRLPTYVVLAGGEAPGIAESMIVAVPPGARAGAPPASDGSTARVSGRPEGPEGERAAAEEEAVELVVAGGYGIVVASDSKVVGGTHVGATPVAFAAVHRVRLTWHAPLLAPPGLGGVGCRALVSGLRARPELNGCVATVLAPPPAHAHGEDARAVVELERPGAAAAAERLPLKLRPANLWGGDAARGRAAAAAERGGGRGDAAGSAADAGGGVLSAAADGASVCRALLAHHAPELSALGLAPPHPRAFCTYARDGADVGWRGSRERQFRVLSVVPGQPGRGLAGVSPSLQRAEADGVPGAGVAGVRTLPPTSAVAGSARAQQQPCDVRWPPERARPAHAPSAARRARRVRGRLGRAGRRARGGRALGRAGLRRAGGARAAAGSLQRPAGVARQRCGAAAD